MRENPDWIARRGFCVLELVQYEKGRTRFRSVFCSESLVGNLPSTVRGYSTLVPTDSLEIEPLGFCMH